MHFSFLLWVLILLAHVVAAAGIVYLAMLAVAACFSRTRPLDSGGSPNTHRFLFVIPAHNEETSIQSTVRSCLACAYPQELFSVLVIADNCTDRTAQNARDAGARVIERADTRRRSKGYALEDVFKQLEHDRTFDRLDAVVLVDADTLVDGHLLRAFDQRLTEASDWIQAYYTVRNPNQSWRTRLLTLAFALVNGVWLMGQDRLGLSVGLKGNGMCFTVRGLRRVPWSASGLVEDMEFAWHLRLAGERVRFEPRARVYAEMVSTGGTAAQTQRQRWESGRASLKNSVRPKLNAAFGRIPLPHWLGYQFDLWTPPLVRLVGQWIGVAMLSILVLAMVRAQPGFWLALLALEFTICLALLFYLMSPFLVLGLPWSYLRDLWHVPTYAFWKIAHRSRTRPSEWVRTGRESENPSRSDKHLVNGSEPKHTLPSESTPHGG
jgi:cellulose synthase/poly-beta-1,6-N-acetylglucosamine synthase-like glycosyltransferase